MSDRRLISMSGIALQICLANYYNSVIHCTESYEQDVFFLYGNRWRWLHPAHRIHIPRR